MVSVKTKLAVLRGANIANVKVMATKNRMFAIPPMISRGSSTFVAKMLQKTGTAKTAQASKVPCHWCGTYEGLLKMIRPCIWVPIRNAGCAVL